MLAHQLNHSTPLDAANLGKNAHVSQVILTHLPELTQKNSKSFISNAKKFFQTLLLLKIWMCLIFLRILKVPSKNTPIYRNSKYSEK